MSEGANTIGHSRKWVFGVSTQNLDLHSLWTILMCRAKQSGAAGNENSVTENPGFETHHQKIRIITKQKHPTNSKSNFDAKQRWKTRGVVFCLVTVYWVVKESVMQLSNKGEKTVYYTKIILCYFLFGVLGAKTAIVKFRVWEGKSGNLGVFTSDFRAQLVLGRTFPLARCSVRRRKCNWMGEGLKPQYSFFFFW